MALLAWGSGAVAEAGTISLWRHAVVTENDVRLGEVARLEGFATADTLAATVVGKAPVPGQTLVLTSDTVRGALREAGVNLADAVVKGAARCEVARARTSDPDDGQAADSAADAAAGGAGRTLRQAVEEYLAAEVGRTDGRIELQFGRTPAAVLDLREPDFVFEVKRTSGSGLGMAGLEVTVWSKDQTTQAVPLLVDVRFVKAVVVAARPINFAATIDPSDVRLLQMEFTRLDRISLDDPAAVVGQRAKRFIAAGELINTRDLESVPLIRRGQVVEVCSRAGGVVIRSAAKATADAAYGDEIELRSGDRGRDRMLGIVKGPGLVEIGAPGESRAREGTRLASGEHP